MRPLSACVGDGRECAPRLDRAGSACQPFCRDTSGIGCCNFSAPYLECGGCDEEHDCYPGAKCFREIKAEL